MEAQLSALGLWTPEETEPEPKAKKRPRVKARSAKRCTTAPGRLKPQASRFRKRWKRKGRSKIARTHEEPS